MAPPTGKFQIAGGRKGARRGGSGAWGRGGAWGCCGFVLNRLSSSEPEI